MKLFVYGSLKPGQLGDDFFSRNRIQIRKLGKATLRDFQLLDFDGVPLANESKGSEIIGQLLEIQTPSVDRARLLLEQYEGFSSLPRSPNWARPIRWASGNVYLTTDSSEHMAEFFSLNSASLDDEDRLRLSKVESSEWNMAHDQVFLRVLPTLWLEIERITRLGPLHSSEEQGTYASLEQYVRLLGGYMVLYTCLERFVRHRFGPTRIITRLNADDSRPSVSKLLEREYFGRQLDWFAIEIEDLQVYEMRSAARNVSLREKPPRFWQIVRNNLSHQSKVPTHLNYRLVLAAAVTLGDFLPQCLLNSPCEVGQQFSSTWRKMSEETLGGRPIFPPERQHLQKLYLATTSHYTPLDQ